MPATTNGIAQEYDPLQLVDEVGWIWVDDDWLLCLTYDHYGTLMATTFDQCEWQAFPSRSPAEKFKGLPYMSAIRPSSRPDAALQVDIHISGGASLSHTWQDAGGNVQEIIHDIIGSFELALQKQAEA